jgi:hypothetical protein
MRYVTAGTGSDHGPSHGRVARLPVVTGGAWGMASRDEWFAINVSDQVGQTLGAARGAASGFFVDPAAAPAMRAGFEEAIQEMYKARKAMAGMQFIHAQGVKSCGGQVRSRAR